MPSGLQRDVLHLYRQCLRAAGKKSPEVRENFKAFARRQFRANAALNKKDFAAIEYLLRKGQRQLEIYASPGIRNIA